MLTDLEKINKNGGDNNNDNNNNNNDKQRLGRTTSLNIPQTGQEHRSSEDFYLREAESGFVRWETTNSTAGFSINKNKRFASDETPYRYLINGSVVPQVSSGRKHYVADPCDAEGAFKVKAYEAKTAQYVIACRHKPLSSQDHRASDNFTCGGTISCPDKITFKVMKDVSGGTDKTLIEKAENGTVIKADGQMYFADPNGATAPFLVEIVQG